MTEETSSRKDAVRSLSILAMVNVGIWAISIVALVFVMRHSPGAKGLFPILAGGVAVGILLNGAVARLR